jgi:hypothetical protein
LPPAAAVVCVAADAACASDCETIANAIATESDPDSSSFVADFSCGADCVVFADPSVPLVVVADCVSNCTKLMPAPPVPVAAPAGPVEPEPPAADGASVAFAADEPAAAPAVAGMPRRLVALLETDLSATGEESKR